MKEAAAQLQEVACYLLTRPLSYIDYVRNDLVSHIAAT